VLTNEVVLLLSDRKLQILEALICDYIFTNEPVGSRTISKKYLSTVSSATIRNEMSDLEEMGYLEKPHTSAGRIPSDKAYRLYVDHIMKTKQLGKNEVDVLQKNIDENLSNVEDLILRVSKLLSSITNYTTIIGTPKMYSNVIQSIHVIKLNAKNIIVVLVFNTGIIKNLVINLFKDVDDNYILKLGFVLNKFATGAEVQDIKRKFEESDENIDGIPKSNLKWVMDSIINTLNSMDMSDYYLGGTTNIFNFPEFTEIPIAKSILDTLTEKDLMSNLLSNLYSNQNNIVIGKENLYEPLQKCSIISSTYALNDKVVGTISIIGPTRMEYSKVMAWIEHTSHYLTCILNDQYK
jgi:heat-inducible transcriptional repressor